MAPQPKASTSDKTTPGAGKKTDAPGNTKPKRNFNNLKGLTKRGFNNPMIR